MMKGEVIIKYSKNACLFSLMGCLFFGLLSIYWTETGG